MTTGVEMFYKTENGILYYGDCLEVMDSIKDSFDMVLSDIPYGCVNRESSGLRNLDKGDADICDFELSVLIEKLQGKANTHYLFCEWSQVSELRFLFEKHGFTTRYIIWEKTNPTPMNGQHLWLSGIELCIYARKEGAIFNGHCRNTVLRYKSGTSDFHPTQKNIELFKDLILTSSNVNGTVFDPFLGSGTTAIAAMDTGRKFVTIEKKKNIIN